MIQLNILKSGDLEIILKDKQAFLDYFDITIDENTKEISFNNSYLSVGDVLESINYIGNGWFDCTGLVGLTDSPIIGYDIDFDDNDKPIFSSEGTKLWWYPEYMIKNEWETLINESKIIFTQALD